MHHRRRHHPGSPRRGERGTSRAPLTIPLEPVDAVSVTTLVDNVTDLLATDTGPAKRPFIGDATRGPSPLFEGGWLYEGLIAEHGFSVLATVESRGTAHRILFDAGLSPDALMTNMQRLGPRPARRGDHRAQPQALRPHHNITRCARRLTGVGEVYAVLGGFHLGGPLFEPLIPRVCEEPEALSPSVIVPLTAPGGRPSALSLTGSLARSSQHCRDEVRAIARPANLCR